MFASVAVLYAILLIFTALVFWGPGLLFTWVFDAIFQLARYPIGVYPGWLQLALTWIIPVAVLTTIPAQALTGEITPGVLLASLAFRYAVADLRVRAVSGGAAALRQRIELRRPAPL